MVNINEVLEFIRNPQLSRDDRRRIVETLNMQVRAARRQSKAGFRVGQLVSWSSNTLYGQRVTGRITKVNRVNIDIVEVHTHAKWRVSPSLLQHVVTEAAPGVTEDEFQDDDDEVQIVAEME